ncbi:MAG: hypothetical protein U1E98_05115 [Moraxella osloensis]
MTASNSENNSENRLISQNSLVKTHPQKKAHSHQTFRLTQLFSTQLDKWLIAAFLGIMTALSVIGLLMTSGWFISRRQCEDGGTWLTRFNYRYRQRLSV